MTNLDVNPEIKDLASGSNYGEFYDAVHHIHDFNSFSRGEAPRLQRSLSCIIGVLATATTPTLDEAILEVLEGMLGAEPNIDVTEDDIENRIRKEWPELGFESGDVGKTMRALNGEDLLHIVYSEGVPSLLRIRLPSRVSDCTLCPTCHKPALSLTTVTMKWHPSHPIQELLPSVNENCPSATTRIPLEELLTSRHPG